MATSKSMRRVQDALRDHGIETVVREMPASTRTAVAAAEAVGCEVGQIVKSLVFVAGDGGVILAATSGANRVDAERLGALVGSTVAMADPDTVRRATGYAIGGVPPVGLTTDVRVLVDEDLLRYDAVWAAAGTPRSVFRIAPADLVAVTGGTVAAFAAAG